MLQSNLKKNGNKINIFGLLLILSITTGALVGCNYSGVTTNTGSAPSTSQANSHKPVDKIPLNEWKRDYSIIDKHQIKKDDKTALLLARNIAKYRTQLGILGLMSSYKDMKTADESVLMDIAAQNTNYFDLFSVSQYVGESGCVNDQTCYVTTPDHPAKVKKFIIEHPDDSIIKYINESHPMGEQAWYIDDVIESAKKLFGDNFKLDILNTDDYEVKEELGITHYRWEGQGCHINEEIPIVTSYKDNGKTYDVDFFFVDSHLDDEDDGIYDVCTYSDDVGKFGSMLKIADIPKLVNKAKIVTYTFTKRPKGEMFLSSVKSSYDPSVIYKYKSDAEDDIVSSYRSKEIKEKMNLSKIKLENDMNKIINISCFCTNPSIDKQKCLIYSNSNPISQYITKNKLYSSNMLKVSDVEAAAKIIFGNDIKIKHQDTNHCKYVGSLGIYYYDVAPITLTK